MEQASNENSKNVEESLTDAPEKTIKQTLINKYREDYKNALLAIDNDVKDLIKQGREMKGLMLLAQNMQTIMNIHESLTQFYVVIFNNQQILKRFKSERLKQLGHELEPIYELIKDVDFGYGEDSEIKEKTLVRTFRKMGITKSHWLIKDRILLEIEYMLDTLEILVEPEFIPLEEDINDSNSSEAIDRYIPPAIKLAVWRRDQGKCAHCGSKEKLEYDHIIPISKGGSNTERNVQLLCEKCNREKAAKIV
ncbi:hypothetical protein TRIP_B220103 [uncultured Desulfatiglans sp.]|nr:hypothetical protein TRIP_B220103 [uncultured Desulfatiglans sp.]